MFYLVELQCLKNICYDIFFPDTIIEERGWDKAEEFITTLGKPLFEKRNVYLSIARKACGKKSIFRAKSAKENLCNGGMTFQAWLTDFHQLG